MAENLLSGAEWERGNADRAHQGLEGKLSSLAAHFDVKAPVLMQQTCLDPKLQWSETKNVWQNAAIRTMLYWMVYPAIWLGKRLRR